MNPFHYGSGPQTFSSGSAGGIHLQMKPPEEHNLAPQRDRMPSHCSPSMGAASAAVQPGCAHLSLLKRQILFNSGIMSLKKEKKVSCAQGQQITQSCHDSKPWPSHHQTMQTGKTQL